MSASVPGTDPRLLRLVFTAVLAPAHSFLVLGEGSDLGSSLTLGEASDALRGTLYFQTRWFCGGRPFRVRLPPQRPQRTSILLCALCTQHPHVLWTLLVRGFARLLFHKGSP